MVEPPEQGEHIAAQVLNRDNGRHANKALSGNCFFVGNSKTIGQQIAGGVCHRFPDLQFVSVESGISWIPFALQYMDWLWIECRVHREHPDYELLPSEFFKRQIYGCFWFENAASVEFAIDQIGVDRILYETDFPHPVSMSPGPASEGGMAAREFIDSTLGSCRRTRSERSSTTTRRVCTSSDGRHDPTCPEVLPLWCRGLSPDFYLPTVGARAVDEVPIDGPAHVETFTVDHRRSTRVGGADDVCRCRWDGRPDVKVLGRRAACCRCRSRSRSACP